MFLYINTSFQVCPKYLQCIELLIICHNKWELPLVWYTYYDKSIYLEDLFELLNSFYIVHFLKTIWDFLSSPATTEQKDETAATIAWPNGRLLLSTQQVGYFSIRPTWAEEALWLWCSGPVSIVVWGAGEAAQSAGKRVGMPEVTVVWEQWLGLCCSCLKRGVNCVACDTDGNHQTGLTEARGGRWRVTAQELQDTRQESVTLL